MSAESFSFDATLSTSAQRKMWMTYADCLVDITRHDVRKLLWRLIAILLLNGLFFIFIRWSIFLILMLIAFPLFAIFMRLSYRKARRNRQALLDWLEQQEIGEEHFSYAVNDQFISWKKETAPLQQFSWKDCAFYHEKEDVLMLFDKQSKLLFLLSRMSLGMHYNSILPIVKQKSKPLLSKSLL